MNHRIWALAIAASLAALAPAANSVQAAMAPARVHYDAPAQWVPFELFRNERIFFNGAINGLPTAMLLDSGAGLTGIDQAFARKIGLKGSLAAKIVGDSQRSASAGQVATGVRIDAGSLHLDGSNVIIFDLAPAMRGIGHDIPVILGREAFKAGIVSIDFPHRRLSFAKRGSFKPPPGSVRVDLHEGGQLPIITIEVGGKPVQAELDLGNGGTLILSNRFWTSRPELAALRHAASQIVGVDGVTPTRSVILPDVEIGGIHFADVPAKLSQDPSAGPAVGANVGIQMFRSSVITFDWAGHALYLQKPETILPFDRDRAGVRLDIVDGGLNVAYVSPDGPAAKAGLKGGDRIVAVDGRRVDSSYYDHADWSHEPAGTLVTLERADGSIVKVQLTDFY